MSRESPFKKKHCATKKIANIRPWPHSSKKFGDAGKIPAASKTFWQVLANFAKVLRDEVLRQTTARAVPFEPTNYFERVLLSGRAFFSMVHGLK